jgi:hypothetical protein
LSGDGVTLETALGMLTGYIGCLQVRKRNLKLMERTTLPNKNVSLANTEYINKKKWKCKNKTTLKI